VKRLLLAVLLTLLAAAPAAQATDLFPGTTWTEEYFPAADGTKLHADVLRPAGLAKEAKTPVIVTVSPYTAHVDGLPSDRFYDFLGLSKAIEHGYTYVMVDLRGFGGSAGCNDWGGPGERMDAKAAVEWAAVQPWSTGKVGVLGKSYDGWTGLMAIAERAKGLAAVVSMEPVYSGYRYLYMDGVRFVNSVATPASFTASDAQPGSPGSDTATYLINGTGANAACYAANLGQQQLDDPTADFWKARDLIPALQGATTPLFLTQGFLEANTKQDGLNAAWAGMTGPKRAWFGQWDHVRGWEKQGDELAMGRDGFIAEVMRFLDHNLKGAPAGNDPRVVVQGADGNFRGESAWPPADAKLFAAPVRAGSYSDDGRNQGSGGSGGNGLWSISAPLATPAYFSGEPQVELEVDGLPRANLVVNVYDISPDGKATMISRGAMILRDGAQTAKPEMYAQDWPLGAGHRVGVLVSGANSEWWEHVPTQAAVTVKSGTVRLPFLRNERDAYLDGKSNPRLRGYLESAPFTVSEATIGEARSAFDLPPALGAAPAGAGRPAGSATFIAGSIPKRLKVRAVRRRGVVVVSGSAPPGTRLRVALLRGRRVVGSRRLTVRRATGGWSVAMRGPRRGVLKVRVTGGGRRAGARVRG
jgi:predicted acyl esterase